MKARCSDEDFVEVFEANGPSKTADILDLRIRSIYRRRRNIEKKIGRQLTSPRATTKKNIQHPHRFDLEFKNGIILIGSDAHYWPGDPSTAHRALVYFCKLFDPVAVIMNGDAFDGAKISRFPPIGWESTPTVEEEIGAVQRRLRELTDAAPNAEHVWPLGNHDGRFETRLATVAPEFAKIQGFHLTDHFPKWTPCWSAWVNSNVVVKHRFKGGIHATHNNAMWAGKTIVTGHLHSLKITPFTDYNGTRWGIDTGTLAEPDGDQFRDYGEDNPKNHRSGFIVLTFHDGKMLDPEIVRVWDAKRVCFRGELIDV
jgi:hypothetical protein